MEPKNLQMPPGKTWETFAEQQIREAYASGEFVDVI